MKRTSEVNEDLAAISSSFSVPEWGMGECDKVAECAACQRSRPLRMVPETKRFECMTCWDRDVLGPEVKS